MMPCPICPGVGVRLGTFGFLVAVRCRDCGADWLAITERFTFEFDGRPVEVEVIEGVAIAPGP